jgi:hypothetical protein
MAPGTSRNVRIAILLIAWTFGGWEFCKRFVSLVPTSEIIIPEGKRQIAISESGITAAYDRKNDPNLGAVHRYGPIDFWDVPKGVQLPSRLTENDEFLDIYPGDRVLLTSRTASTLSVMDALSGTVLCERPALTDKDECRIAEGRLVVFSTPGAFSVYDLGDRKMVWSRTKTQFRTMGYGRIICWDESDRSGGDSSGSSSSQSELILSLETGEQLESRPRQDAMRTTVPGAPATNDRPRSLSTDGRYLVRSRPPTQWIISLDKFLSGRGLKLFSWRIHSSSAEVLHDASGSLYGLLPIGVLQAFPGERDGFCYATEHGVSYYEFPGRRNWPVIIAILAGPPLLISLLIKARRRKVLQRTAAGMSAAATHG